ncbi:hypothetical protein [Allosediminivita pacifica]|uniref:Uncharacterized protein n=1 Tax=Allosediminivita pacifica TaxID=1267769 RepID=A0A2T6APL8_9RHOB|nr:hypothetical protein [Allosediminivita pacifica]PTX45755.1 hypothetical protein C8N44_120111 [Allosediminivita pacifica]GGB07657.1 hypothetical protein GCM10011324_17310 [Allosediminivita pacifica]
MNYPIFAVCYLVVPGAERGVLPKLNFGVAAVGLVLIVPGIALALAAQGDTLAKLGSVLTIAAMALFAAVVIRR